MSKIVKVLLTDDGMRDLEALMVANRSVSRAEMIRSLITDKARTLRPNVAETPTEETPVGKRTYEPNLDWGRSEYDEEFELPSN